MAKSTEKSKTKKVTQKEVTPQITYKPQASAKDMAVESLCKLGFVAHIENGVLMTQCKKDANYLKFKEQFAKALNDIGYKQSWGIRMEQGGFIPTNITNEM